MNLDLSKEELILLRHHLGRELENFRRQPTEWNFWKDTFRLEELDTIFKKIDSHLESIDAIEDTF